MRGVSPIVATLLIIAIIVVAAVGLYFVTMGIMQENQPEEAEFIRLTIIPAKDIATPGAAVLGRIYFEVGAENNWLKALDKCKNAYAHLLTITGPRENNFVINTFCSSGGCWLGLYQKPGAPEPDSGWEWVTGEPTYYTYWNTGEPNNGGDGYEEVAEIQSGYTLWNDISVTPQKLNKVVCERVPLSFTIKNEGKRSVRINEISIKITNGSGDVVYYIGTLSDVIPIEVETPSGTLSYTLPRFMCSGEVIPPGGSIQCKVVALPLEGVPTKYRVCIGIESPVFCGTT